MFDPNIKVRVVADYKYKDGSYLVANSYLSFDIYDSTKIAELINLYNSNYEYKDHIELPSIDSLPFHVKQQLQETYKFNKPQEADGYLPPSDKPLYETVDDTYSPFAPSSYEDKDNFEVLADNTYEPKVEEPRFIELTPPSPSVAEVKDVVVKEEVVKEEAEETTKEEPVVEQVYSVYTQQLLKLTKEQLEDKSAADIKKAVLEVDSKYDYTNKVEAIKYLLTIK
jgi:glycogen debranching enzyme